jgi:hypothetical protein
MSNAVRNVFGGMTKTIPLDDPPHRYARSGNARSLPPYVGRGINEAIEAYSRVHNKRYPTV